MFEVQIFIPICDNQGTLFGRVHHQVFEAFLLDHFTGFTRLPHRAVGGWKEDGVTYLDRSMVYVVALDTLGAGGLIRKAADFAKAHYAQLAIYVRYLGLSEVM